MELISIIIPIFNVESYLDRCIASVSDQTYQNLEIILVDDGSTDRSGQICDEWAARDPRIRVIHQPNSGVSAARNTGLHAASGDWIIQVDSDDYVAPYAVQQLLGASRNTGADMVICDFVKGSDEAYCFTKNTAATVETEDGVSMIRRLYDGDHSALRYGVPWCKMSRKKLYDGILYPDGKIFEDIYTTHKLLFRCQRIAVLETPLFYYFQRPGSIMNMSFSMKKLDYLQALVERVAFFQNHGLDELEQIAYDELLHSLVWEYSRTRDLLNSQAGMDYVISLFRQVYKKGHASRRYPQETAHFLTAFRKNPEWIILYWKVSGKLKQLFKRNG